MRMMVLAAFAAITGLAAPAAAVEKLACGQDYTTKGGDTAHQIASQAYDPGLHRQLLVSILLHKHGSTLAEGTVISIPCASGAGFELPVEYWTGLSRQPAQVVVQTVGYDRDTIGGSDGLPPMLSALFDDALTKGLLEADFQKLDADSFAAYRPFPVSANAGDLSFPWLGSDCSDRANQGARPGKLCVESHWSDPIFELTSAAYVPASSETDNLTTGRICVADESRAAVQASGLPILSSWSDGVAGSALDCIGMIQKGLVTAIIVPDLVAARESRRTPKAKLLRRVEAAAFTDTVHAVIDKSNPDADRLLKRLNSGIAKIRTNGEWYQIIQAHLTRQLRG